MYIQCCEKYLPHLDVSVLQCCTLCTGREQSREPIPSLLKKNGGLASAMHAEHC